ncbi:MAG TPA: farnesyl diphosphate synthase [Fimbriimonadaceae bacterium]|nr:farnesyl diphosphate synthase [Fimbriimonadaceae bacterium]
MPLDVQLKAYADLANARLDQLLPTGDTDPAELHQAMRYSCLAPGKRLRPALCMASAEAAGGSSRQVLDAACAIEMVHCFSLIHDDLPAIDDDDLRRGLPTCHKRFGEAIAILAGDALFALAFEVLSHVCVEPASRVLRSVRILTKATGSDGLVGGEVVDVLSEGVAIGADRLRFIHSRKTGALMSAACEIGALLAGGSEGQIDRLGEFGSAVGLAFQIADDILNETADTETLGKAARSDRGHSKATYVSLFGLEEARRLANETVRRAKDCLAGMSDSEFLFELAEFAVLRAR